MRPRRLRTKIGRLGRRTVALAVVLSIALSSSPAAADMASPELDKYEQPVDEAIERALLYLAQQQQKDGSFKGGNTAITSLAVMAFLAKGYTPGTGPYGKVINRGIDFVAGSQHRSGLLLRSGHGKGSMYSHGIATLMLSEISGMVDPERQKRVDKALSEALKLILGAQGVRKRNKKDQGGWRYNHDSDDADISCTGWQLMALRSARSNGAMVPKQSIDKAVQYVLRCRSEGGGFCYQSATTPGKANGPGLGRTGTALLCLELLGYHGDKITLDAGKWVLRSIGYGGSKKRRVNDRHFYYATYYASQGMFQLGDEYWVKFADVMYPQLLGTQQKDGSWGNSQHGPTYATSMAVLAMSVVYRQLPIYQR